MKWGLSLNDSPIVMRNFKLADIYTDDEQEENGDADDTNSQDAPSSASEPEEIQGPSSASLKFSVKDLKLGLTEANSPLGFITKKSASCKLSDSQIGLGVGQSSMSDSENKGVSLPPGLHPKKIRMIRKHRVEILSEAALCILKGNTFQHVSEVYDVPKTTLRDFMVRRGLLQRGPPRKSVVGPPGSSLSPTMKTDSFGHDSGASVNDSDIL